MGSYAAFKAQQADNLSGEVARLRARVVELEAGIAAHREDRGVPKTSDGRYAGFDCDRELWSLLTPTGDPNAPWGDGAAGR